MNNQILYIIDLLNRTYGRYSEGSGGCLKFHILLKLFLPNQEVIAYYDENHFLSCIDGIFYDVDGIANHKLTQRFIIVFPDQLERIIHSFKEHLNEYDINLLYFLYPKISTSTNE